MKKILLIICLLVSVVGISQTVVQRASPANTVDDPNGMNSRSKIIPRYQDTTEANSKYNTLDSAGKIIYTRGDKSFWYRQDAPKKWVKVASGNNLSNNFFFDSICNCYKIDTISLMNIINNFTGDSSITNISILNDSTIRICYGNGTCVDIGIVTNITNINNIQFLNDSTIIVCNVDTTDVNTQTCDTIVIGRKSPTLIYQNGVRFHDNIVEFGDDMSVNGGFQQPGMLRHNTTLDFLYNTLRYQSAKVYDYGFQVNKYPNFGFENGTGLQSWLHENNQANPNTVRLGINYTDSVYTGTPNLKGYFGDRVGYFMGTNATGEGSFGFKTDNQYSKISGILFHTTDTSYTDAVTIYGKQYPNVNNGVATIALDSTMLPYRIASFNTDKSVMFHGYNSANFTVTDTGRYKPAVFDSTDGTIKKGHWFGSGALAQYHLYVGNSSSQPVDAGSNFTFNGTSVGLYNSTITPYATNNPNDAIKIISNNLGASFGVQNSNASGYSGIEYINNAGDVKVFTGFNNSNGQEFRFNNISTGGYINFLIGNNLGLRINNDRSLTLGVTPAYTSGGYDVLVRNQTTGNVEKTTISAGGGGTVTSVGATISGALAVTGGPITTSGTLAFAWQGTSSQYIAGDGSLVTFPSTISGITANNGLTASTSTNVQLGGSLTSPTTIAGGSSNTLSITGSSTSSNTLYVTNTSSGTGIGIGATSGAGLNAFSTSGTAILGTSSSSLGGYFSSGTNTGLQAQSSSGIASVHKVDNNSTNTQLEVLRIERDANGVTAANGIGGYISYSLEDNGGQTEAGRLIYKLTDVTHATPTSQFIITGVSSGVTSNLMVLDGNGNATFGTTNSIVGTATNNDAVAGNIGEYVSGTVALGSAVTLTTATTANVTSISLTAGDWDVTGVVDFDLSGTTVSDFLMGTSTTSATLGSQDTYLEQALPFTSVTYSNNVPTVRYSLSSTTTVYLVTSLSFTGGAAKAYGTIRARRVR